MYYSILHKTRFRYSAPISESLTETRMRPLSEGFQRCLKFNLTTSPNATIHHYQDAYANAVQHFDIPGQHRQLTITAEAIVAFTEPPRLPRSLSPEAWNLLDDLVAEQDVWDFLAPSHFARPSPLLNTLAEQLDVRRRGDPLSLLFEIAGRMYRTFAYAPQTTSVDSPIDQALANRKGVCQDFAHIMIALVRPLGIPCRYVSGYLFHRAEDHDRSESDATHAWVEALLPGLGWIGFDPTNNLLARDRHIRVAVGRDYADVPPTKGVHRGRAESTLEVGVKVLPTEVLNIPDTDLLPPVPAPTVAEIELEQQQQQQQQQ
ncbi:transglutaminase domain-containing protein [Oscillochloris trichoides DG-6]|uniref:Transglutaminase domain-containing protein n=1 Tax=Oscillochloris trichoides DG-6 TaxID=765420 RepID=E1IIM4_9CHLR|nr:transglutaminase family protein [Oscillochloris trichoides]EFO78974.1 transglutaminase domain-containing protein [Oscillochloris trichoides DG-6]